MKKIEMSKSTLRTVLKDSQGNPELLVDMFYNGLEIAKEEESEVLRYEVRSLNTNIPIKNTYSLKVKVKRNK